MDREDKGTGRAQTSAVASKEPIQSGSDAMAVAARSSERSTQVVRAPIEGTQAQSESDIIEIKGDSARSNKAARPASSADLPPADVPGYRVTHFLGRGTFGEVWEAIEDLTGIRVAIKFFSHRSGEQLQLLQEEVKQLASLHSDPGIVLLKDVNPDASPPYYIMAYAEHGSLAELIKRSRLPVRKAEFIFHQIAKALAYVHAKGIRHCDLKPGNILLDSQDRALIADFGQAHFSEGASVAPALGTFFYMAPEQADATGPLPDTRWDVYGLGAIFYAMLTGRPPRENERLRGELGKTLRLDHRLQRYREWVEQAPKPEEHRKISGVDRRLREIIDNCIEINPEKRFRDAGAVLEALGRRRRWERQRPTLLFGLIAPTLLLITMAAVGYLGVTKGINEARSAFRRTILESNHVAAKIIANVFDQELSNRKSLIGKFSRSSDLIKAVESADPTDVENVLRQLKEEDKQKQFERLTVADPSGRILMNFPKQEKNLGKAFGWRDWFNGNGDQLHARDEAYEPIDRTHISQPFVSKAIDRQQQISISHPIRNKEDRVIGVLSAPIFLKSLNAWLRPVSIPDGFAVVLNDRGHALEHRENDKIAPADDQNPRSWTQDAPAYCQMLNNREGGTSPDHVDPVDGQIYLAGFAVTKTDGWGILVQRERAGALMPIDELEQSMHRIGWGAFLVTVLVIAGLWVWLFRALRPQEQILNA